MTDLTEGGLFTAGAAAGMLLSIPLVWACDRIAARMRQIRQQRRLLAGMRPRRTVELAQTHQSR
jgi:hypothetical protein